MIRICFILLFLVLCYSCTNNDDSKLLTNYYNEYIELTPGREMTLPDDFVINLRERMIKEIAKYVKCEQTMEETLYHYEISPVKTTIKYTLILDTNQSTLCIDSVEVGENSYVYCNVIKYKFRASVAYDDMGRMIEIKDDGAYVDGSKMLSLQDYTAEIIKVTDRTVIEPFNNNKSYKGIFAIQINNSIVDMLNSERKYRFTIENNKGYLEQLEPIYVSPIELKKN